MNVARTSALALAVVLALMAPTAAHAGSYDHTDPSGDVVSIDGYSEEGEPTTVPDRTDGDILDSRVVHGPRRIYMTMEYAELRKDGDVAGHYFSVLTKKGKVRNFFLVAAEHHWEGSVIRETGRGKSFKCKGVDWSIRYGDKTVQLSVPRRCLGNPAWVRVAMASIKGNLSDDEFMFFYDDATRRGMSETGALTYGGRAYR